MSTVDLDRYAPQALELIDAKLDTMEKTTVSAICGYFNNGGSIAPDTAVQMCVKLATIRQLRSTLRSAERAHVASAARAAKQLD